MNVILCHLHHKSNGNISVTEHASCDLYEIQFNLDNFIIILRILIHMIMCVTNIRKMIDFRHHVQFNIWYYDKIYYHFKPCYFFRCAYGYKESVHNYLNGYFNGKWQVLSISSRSDYISCIILLFPLFLFCFGKESFIHFFPFFWVYRSEVLYTVYRV